MPNERKPYIPSPTIVYRVVRWLLGAVLAIFFQEIDVIGKENVPVKGPVIFVGNHPNQFVDGMMMFTQSPRDVFLLIAESSLRNYAAAGFFAKLQHAIPVYRREDNAYAGKGKLTITKSKTPNDYIITIHGSESFEQQNIKPSDNLMIILHHELAGTDTYKDMQFVVKQLETPTKIISTCSLESAEALTLISEEQLLHGTQFSFKVLPKLDQSKAYEAIFGVLARGDCIGVFPEGGSSDRPQLRKLKVGVAYIALSLKQKYPDLTITIVPCGLNYISGHRFRSKTLIEYGHPLVVSSQIFQRFSNKDKTAVEVLTEQINSRLRSVTLNIPESISGMLNIDPFEAREIINVARRLYQPSSVQLPVDKYLELNRRFANGISKISDEPKLKLILNEIRQYNADRRELGISDRQVEHSPKNWKEAVRGVFTLVSHSVMLLPCVIALPGILLHLPVAIITKMKALSVAQKSAQKSSVKIEGRDVIASTKIVVGVTLMIISYIIYGIIAGILFGWVWALPVFIGIPFYTAFCIKYIDRAGATVRTLIPLAKFLFIKQYRTKCKDLRQRRIKLREAVVAGVKEYGPRFHEYWDHRVVPDTLLNLADEGSHLPFSPVGSSYAHQQANMFDGLADNLFEGKDIF